MVKNITQKLISVIANPIDSNMSFYFILFFLTNLALKKMVVNHIDKTFVTSDAATILK
jgi:hypothetical protein